MKIKACLPYPTPTWGGRVIDLALNNRAFGFCPIPTFGVGYLFLHWSGTGEGGRKRSKKISRGQKHRRSQELRKNRRGLERPRICNNCKIGGDRDGRGAYIRINVLTIWPCMFVGRFRDRFRLPPLWPSGRLGQFQYFLLTRCTVGVAESEPLS